MPRLRIVCLLSMTALLPAVALAQDAPSVDPHSPKWVSHTSTDKTGAHICSVYPLGVKPFPMIFFYARESSGELSLEGADTMPINLTLQVDGNAVLDGGFPAMSKKDTASLIKQIRANGQTLRLSQSVLGKEKMEKLHLDLPLTGAVAELDKCRAWLKP